ncbi:hypothetical protein MUP38_07045 [Candidatus Bathyarchaeota archaeon]|nr:hypothetical protein [Candidatus Bathyarchaeota archaeon]
MTFPQAYYDFVYYYAPWYYVLSALITGDATAGQKEVTVTNGALFLAGMPVEIKDSAHSEWNTVDSVLVNVVTMTTNLAYTYYVAKDGAVDHPDIAYGKGTFPAAFAIEFFYDYYGTLSAGALKTTVLAKIQSLADWLITQQCVNVALKAYGGFVNSEGSDEYWSIDAGRAIPALLKAYSLTGDADHLASAILAGRTFLFNMQNEPTVLALQDTYYGGFATYVDSSDVWVVSMSVENLYCLIGLKMLNDTYDVANAATYTLMMSDARDFLVEGLNDIWMWFDPLPSGDGEWHRIGLTESEVYDDVISFALLGLYDYEGFSTTVQHIYDYVNAIKQTGSYPAYWPAVCWPGYIDVVSRFPACEYYDAISIGILASLRKDWDPPSYALSCLIVDMYPEEFLYWGPVFGTFAPVTPQKANASVTWIGRMLLNYVAPLTEFTKALEGYGEVVELFSIQEAVQSVTYSDPLEIKAFMQPARAEEVIIEAGYIIEDYLNGFTFIPVRHHDKIRRKGDDYEVQSVQLQVKANVPYFYQLSLRRLMAT